MRLTYCILAIALLFTMAACTAGPAEQTDAPSSPASTTLPAIQPSSEPVENPTEPLDEATPADLMPTPAPATEPPETYPLSYNLAEEADWALPRGDALFYQYTGNGTSIPIGDYFTLNLPEAWAEKVVVGAQGGSGSGALHIVVQGIPWSDAMQEFCGVEASYHWIIDPVIEISIYPKTVDGTPTSREQTSDFFAETDEWIICVETRQTRDMDCRTELIEVSSYIERFGQEAYEEAQDGITCTQEEAEAMISLNN